MTCKHSGRPYCSKQGLKWHSIFVQSRMSAGLTRQSAWRLTLKPFISTSIMPNPPRTVRPSVQLSHQKQQHFCWASKCTLCMSYGPPPTPPHDKKSWTFRHYRKAFLLNWKQAFFGPAARTKYIILFASSC